jgi:hypothetical protein
LFDIHRTKLVRSASNNTTDDQEDHTMETAHRPATPTPRLTVLGRALRPRRGIEAQQHGHLHFDRAARVWRTHEEPQPTTAAVALPECA